MVMPTRLYYVNNIMAGHQQIAYCSKISAFTGSSSLLLCA